MEKRKLHKRFFAVLAVMLLILPLFLTGAAGVTAFAAETDYTDALEDLQKDENFNVEEYPDNAKDYSIQVIQIAESTAGELFIYTYQPCQKSRYIVATEINMAFSREFDDSGGISDVIDTDNGYYVGSGAGGGFGGGGGHGCSLLSDNSKATQTNLYSLTLLSSSGTLCKYRVNAFTVSADKIRYYNITSIYRKWDTKIDGIKPNDQTINEKAYAVGQLWTVGTFGNSVVYDVSEVEVIKVTEQMVGFRRYSEGFQFQGTYSCDSHFLAFSCDHAIDRLISADVFFYTRDYKALAGSGTKYQGKVAHKRTLYDDEKVGTDSTGWFDGGDYVWDRMSSTNDYVTNLRAQGSTITDKEEQTLSQYDWILCFYESEYKCSAGGKDVLISALIPFGFVWTIVNGCTTTGTIVSGVTLMRLEFEYQGTVYNMGVVSDKQTGSEKPIGGEVAPITKFFRDLLKGFKDFFTGHSKWWVYLIVALVVLILLPTILGFFIPAVGKFLKSIGKALLWLVKGVWWLMRRVAVLIWRIMSAPFRLIVRAVKRRREEKDNAPDPTQGKRDKTGRIYKTTDGYLSGRSDIKKPRNIAAIEQRKDDGALAVVKVYSRKGKEQKLKEGKNYIPKLVLKPKKHAALKKDSIVGRQVIVGVKQGNGKPPKSIFPGDLEKTQDKLTKKELKKIQAEVQNDNPKNRAHHEAKMKKWRKHFQDK